MFRSRRASLVQRLWRLRCVTPGLDDNCGALKPVAHALFKKLKDQELEQLLQAVESQGAGESGCVWVELRGVKPSPSALLLLCRLYRWPDLRQPHELKRLCFCKGAGGEGAVHCCNPHHLSRLALPDTPPPPYCKISPFAVPLKCANILENTCKGWQGQRKCSPERLLTYKAGLNVGAGPPSHIQAASAPGPFSSSRLKTRAPKKIPRLRAAPKLRSPAQACLSPGTPRNFQDTTLSRCSLKDGYWCKLAYWEYRLRVGRLYPVHEDYICVFSNLPNGSGFCLGQLASRSRSQAVRRTQAKIGRGLLLSQESSGVWAYNRSEHPLFVCSPTLGPVGSFSPPVHKVLPGYSIKVFDYERATSLAARRQGTSDGPLDGHTVRISFAKGWGPSYTRRFISCCPCWLEVLLNAPR